MIANIWVFTKYIIIGPIMWVICVCVSVPVQLSVVCLWNPEVNVEYFPLSFSTLFLKQASLWSGTHHFGYPGWQWAPGVHVSLPPLHTQRWGCRHELLHAAFPWVLQIWLKHMHLCTELSSQPSFKFFIYKLYIYYFYVQFIHEYQGCRKLLLEVK